ncbi:MAG: ThuA domain-containing protein [Janthinobacterium lividum]
MRLLCLLLTLVVLSVHAQTRHVLAFYTDKGEKDHVDFAHQAIDFFQKDAAKEHYVWRATQDWNDLLQVSTDTDQLVVWLNDQPHTAAQRSAFERYMDHGGAWLGFHASAYNDSSTHWPWFVNFLGGAVFRNNNWPPLPAILKVEDTNNLVTHQMGTTYTAPANEWYGWYPNPRDNKDVHVLMSLDPGNYPIGLKDTLTSGDIPVVWTNTRYRMLYVNMGHGDKIFSSPIQNAMFMRAMAWLMSRQ